MLLAVMPSGQRIITSSLNFSFPVLEIEPNVAGAVPELETPSVPNCLSGTPPPKVEDQTLQDLAPIAAFNKQFFVEQTVAPETEGVDFGDGRFDGEERQTPEPLTASTVVNGSSKARKPRKSAKNPTADMVEKCRVRDNAARRAAQCKADLESPDEIYGTEGPVTEESHPHTFSVQFQDPRLPMSEDYMVVRSFQNCLEHYVACESPEKQRSSHRSAETLQRIKERNPNPPPHYPNGPQIRASWK